VKIYIATAFRNVSRYHEVKDALEQLGHEITYDWTESKVADRDAAIKDAQGVAAAHAVIGIFEEDFPYKGAIFELGIAYTLGIPIYILGDWLDSMVFILLPYIHQVSNLEDLLEIFKVEKFNKGRTN